MQTNKLERQINQQLKVLKAKDKTLDFLRIYDSAAARNFLPARPADYLVFKSGKCIALEAKETSKPTVSRARLVQLPRLLRLAMSGVLCYFLIEHKGDYYLINVGVAKEKLKDRKTLRLQDFKAYKNLELLFDGLLKGGK